MPDIERERVLQYLQGWIKKHPSPNIKEYLIDGKMISANELVEEIFSGTKKGNKYCEKVAVVIVLLEKEDRVLRRGQL